jgi:hypothetical protein
MRFIYKDKGYDTKPLLNYLESINDFIVDYKITGYFETLSFNNPNQLSKRGIRKSYQRLINAMTKLHIAFLTKLTTHDFPSTRKGRNSDTFVISKPIYLFWYSVCTYLNTINESEIRKFRRYSINLDLNNLIDKIIVKNGLEKGIIHKNTIINVESSLQSKHDILLKHYTCIIEHIYQSLTIYLNKDYIITNTKHPNNNDKHITHISVKIKDIPFNKSNPIKASSEAYIYRSNKTRTFLTNLAPSWFTNNNLFNTFSNFDLHNISQSNKNYKVKSSKELIKLISKDKLTELFRPIYLKIDVSLSKELMEIFKMDLAHIYFKSSKLLQAIAKEQSILIRQGYSASFNLKIEMIHIKNYGYKILVSGRQYNHLCGLPRQRRTVELKQFDYLGNYDLHSAIYSIAKLLNTGAFDADWDLKDSLLQKGFKNYEDKPLNRDDYKRLSFRMFFASSEKQSFGWYSRALAKISADAKTWLPQITKAEFQKIYSFYQQIITSSENKEIITDEPLGSKNYLYNIFFIESLAELRVIKELIKNGIDFKNIYDCFYYKPSTSDLVVKKIVTMVMKGIHNDFAYLSLFNKKEIKDDDYNYDFRLKEIEIDEN